MLSNNRSWSEDCQRVRRTERERETWSPYLENHGGLNDAFDWGHCFGTLIEGRLQRLLMANVAPGGGNVDAALSKLGNECDSFFRYRA
jgi:hypothetical protein